MEYVTSSSNDQNVPPVLIKTLSATSIKILRLLNHVEHRKLRDDEACEFFQFVYLSGEIRNALLVGKECQHKQPFNQGGD